MCEQRPRDLTTLSRAGDARISARFRAKNPYVFYFAENPTKHILPSRITFFWPHHPFYANIFPLRSFKKIAYLSFRGFYRKRNSMSGWVAVLVFGPYHSKNVPLFSVSVRPVRQS
jgi:hypothetical protein